MHLCKVLWEIWLTDGDRRAVVTFSCHSGGGGGTSSESKDKYGHR